MAIRSSLRSGVGLADLSRILRDCVSLFREDLSNFFSVSLKKFEISEVIKKNQNFLENKPIR